MSSSLTADFDPWTDLVFHGLAHLDIQRRDASRLYSAVYVHLVDDRLPTPDHAHRTLPTDAKTLATLYDRTPGAHQLQGMATWHESVETFLSSLRAPHPASSPTDPPLPEALVELFRIGLWGEVQAGFLEYHDRFLGPQYAVEVPRLEAELTRRLPAIPALQQVRWRLSHPLGHAGRLLDTLVVVGLPDPALQVSLAQILVQGIHECLLGVVLERGAAREGTPPADPREGTAGYVHHLVPELLALCLDARALGDDVDLAPTFRAWLSRYYPRGTEDLLRELTVAGIPPRGRAPTGAGRDVEGLIDWLRSGGPIPADQRGRYDDAAARALRSSP